MEISEKVVYLDNAATTACAPEVLAVMTEALSAVIAYTFNKLRVNRIEAQYELDNPASGAVMKKCGMTYEGTLRQRLYNKGRYVDVGLCSILKSEYVSHANFD